MALVSRTELRDCEGKQTLNRTLEIGCVADGCTQSQLFKAEGLDELCEEQAIDGVSVGATVWRSLSLSDHSRGGLAEPKI